MTNAYLLCKLPMLGSLVKGLRRRPLTAETGVRFPYELLGARAGICSRLFCCQKTGKAGRIHFFFAQKGKEREQFPLFCCANKLVRESFHNFPQKKQPGKFPAVGFLFVLRLLGIGCGFRKEKGAIEFFVDLTVVFAEAGDHPAGFFLGIGVEGDGQDLSLVL